MLLGVANILTLLDKLPIWKRLKNLPLKVEMLEKRVEALEKKKSAPHISEDN